MIRRILGCTALCLVLLAAARSPGEVKTGKYEIVFDTSETPELRPWVDAALRPVCQKWYPRIVAMLPSEGYTAPRRFTVTFRKEMKGVAYTTGTRIVCAADWFGKNLKGEAAGAVVHEMVHVVQQYRQVKGGNRNPGWLVEGMADYIRWFKYEPPSLRPARIPSGPSTPTATAPRRPFWTTSPRTATRTS